LETGKSALWQMLFVTFARVSHPLTLGCCESLWPDLLPDTFEETRFFTCLNGQLGALETLCGAEKPHSSAKNLVSEPCCKKCPVVNGLTELLLHRNVI
jgi:hypothetical protein